MLVVSWFVCISICFLLYCYLFCKFVNRSEFKIGFNMLFFSFMLGIIYAFINKYSLVYIRPYFIHLYTFFYLLIKYKQKFIKTIIGELCIFIILCISELLFGVVEIFVFKIDIKQLVGVWYGYLISNLIIYIITFLFSKINFVKKIIINIIDWHNKNESKSFSIAVVLCMFIFTFLLYNNFIKLLPRSILWVTNLFCVGVIFFVINYFKEKANNNRIIDEYDQLLGYVQRYEKVVEDKSKNQHEYKNQLVMLKSMINKSNKKAINYLDGLYKDINDNEDIELLKKLKYLPNGGLKGLIYYKIEEMIDKGINVFVDISSELKNVKMNNEIDKNLKDISKSIGVYVDNAIEASIDSKEKYIILEVYLENDEWVFSLSNSYSNKFNVSMIDQEGYSTKGDGKGYGLSLVKDIIEHNKDLRQEKELNGIYYTQRLYMKK